MPCLMDTFFNWIWWIFGTKAFNKPLFQGSGMAYLVAERGIFEIKL